MKLASLKPVLPRSAIRRRQLLPSRHYAMQVPGAPMLQVFNDNTKQLQRERAAADTEASRRVDYLRDEVASRLCERLLVPSSNPHPSTTCATYSIARTSIAILPVSSILVPMPAILAELLPYLFQALHHSLTGSHI